MSSDQGGVVIPAYQAEGTLGPIVRAIVAQGLPVIVVDDASTDQTAEEAERAGAEMIRRGDNGGKGAALRDGLARAAQRGWLWVITLDADGQHLASEIPLLLKAAAATGADLVIGNRMGNPHGMPPGRRLTNRLMSWFISRMIGRQVPDTQCGFRWISRRALEGIRLSSDRYEVESEMLIRSVWAGFRIASVPISSVYRRGVSFIRPFRDTVRFLALLRRLSQERASAERSV